MADTERTPADAPVEAARTPGPTKSSNRRGFFTLQHILALAIGLGVLAITLYLTFQPRADLG